MSFFAQFLIFPSFLLLCVIASYARWIRAALFLDSLVVGTWTGLVATIVYDGVRFVVQRTHPFGYNGFVPILMYGSWITNKPTNSGIAVIAGWAYHFWTGTSFGLMYALAVGRRNWLFGVLWGVFLELCTLGLFPMFIRISSQLDFIVISMVGHVAYGATLGLLVQRYAKW